MCSKLCRPDGVATNLRHACIHPFPLATEARSNVKAAPGANAGGETALAAPSMAGRFQVPL